MRTDGGLAGLRLRAKVLGWKAGKPRAEGSGLPVIRLGWPVSCVWLLPQTSEGPFLVDSGFPTSWPRILLGIRAAGLHPSQIQGLILTHRHVDHAGNAPQFAHRYGIPVYAHREDANLLNGTLPSPKLAQPLNVVGALSLIENHFPARVPRVIPLEHGDKIAGLEVLWMPGHTRGSVFLFHRQTGTLFSGDGLLNAVPPLVTKTALSLPFEGYCDDYPQALESLRSFVSLDLDVKRLCPGHGPVRHGAVNEPVRRMLDLLETLS